MQKLGGGEKQNKDSSGQTCLCKPGPMVSVKLSDSTLNGTAVLRSALR